MLMTNQNTVKPSKAWEACCQHTANVLVLSSLSIQTSFFHRIEMSRTTASVVREGEYSKTKILNLKNVEGNESQIVWSLSSYGISCHCLS